MVGHHDTLITHWWPRRQHRLLASRWHCASTSPHPLFGSPACSALNWNGCHTPPGYLSEYSCLWSSLSLPYPTLFSRCPGVAHSYQNKYILLSLCFGYLAPSLIRELVVLRRIWRGSRSNGFSLMAARSSLYVKCLLENEGWGVFYLSTLGWDVLEKMFFS